MLRVIILLCIITSLPALRASNVEEVTSTRLIGQVRAFSPSGRVSLQTAEALVDVRLADGTPTKGDFLVIYDPATQRFLWTESTHAPNAPFDLVLQNGIGGSSSHAIISYASRLLRLQTAGMTFECRYSTESAKDLDEAFSHALSELNSGWATRYQKAEFRNTKTIDFREDELRSFLHNTEAPTLVIPRIEDIRFTDSSFVVTLLGMWKGEVTIGEDLTVKERFHEVTALSEQAKR